MKNHDQELRDNSLPYSQGRDENGEGRAWREYSQSGAAQWNSTWGFDFLFGFIVGACEGGMACATCHVILSKEYYDKLPEPSEAEEDCLDNAAGLTET